MIRKLSGNVVWKRVTSIVFHCEFLLMTKKQLDDIFIDFFSIEFVDECVSGAVKDFLILLPDPKCRKESLVVMS